MEFKRAVITGMGAISPIGIGIDEIKSNLKKNKIYFLLQANNFSFKREENLGLPIYQKIKRLNFYIRLRKIPLILECGKNIIPVLQD